MACSWEYMSLNDQIRTVTTSNSSFFFSRQCRSTFLSWIALLLFTTPLQAQLLAPAREVSKQSKAIAQLRILGYWTGPTDSMNSAPNKQALIAFQKVTGRPRTGRWNDAEYDAILSSPTPLPHDSLHLMHLEIDLNRQILFLFDSTDKVIGIIPVSTGSGKYFETEDRKS